MGPAPPPVIQRIDHRHRNLTGTVNNSTRVNNPGTPDNATAANYVVENGYLDGATARMMQPSVHLVTPPPTPEKPDKVTGEIILKLPHGTITGTCHRLQCLGYIVKVITNQRDPKGWHLECNRKEDRVRPCNFRRDGDGNVTKPLSRPPPPTPTRRRVVQRNVGVATKGTTPSTPAGKGGAAPIPSPATPKALKTSGTAKFTQGGRAQAQKSSGTVNPTQGRHGQASKTFGNTQRVLFPITAQATGKRPAGDTHSGVNAPAPKRPCNAVRNTSSANSTATVKDEFDEDFDMGFWDAASQLAKKVEASVGPMTPVQSRNIATPRASQFTNPRTPQTPQYKPSPLGYGLAKRLVKVPSRPITTPMNRPGVQVATPSRANSTATSTPTMGHQAAQHFTPAPAVTALQYMGRMTTAAQPSRPAGIPSMPNAVTTREATPRKQQQNFIRKPSITWGPPSAPGRKAPGYSQFEPIVLD